MREFNVFRWAGRMLADAGRWRLRDAVGGDASGIGRAAAILADAAVRAAADVLLLTLGVRRWLRLCRRCPLAPSR